MPERQADSIPLWERWRRRFLRTRELADHEWSPRFDGGGEISALFFAARSPTAFDLTVLGDPLEITALEYGEPDHATAVDFVLEQAPADRVGARVICKPRDVRPTQRVTIRFRDPGGDVQGHLRVWAKREKEPDLELVNNAHYDFTAGRVERAINQLLEYEQRFSGENAAVCYWTAEWSQTLGRTEVAEEYAARAFANGNPEVCGTLYRSVQEARLARPVEELRKLQNMAAEWTIGAQHGLVILERDQHHVLGLGDFELRKLRETLEVRRPAAARMLNQLEFPFSGGQEMLLHTSLRVVHADGEVEHVPLERFTVGDHASNNIFITVDDEKAGHWILPDLTPGDVIEWGYHLLHRNRKVADTPQTFSLSSPFHAHLATFRAQHVFVAPKELSLRFSVRNGELKSAEGTLESRTAHTFVGDRFVPAKQTGFTYENQWLNPLIACASGDADWKAVADSARKTNFGDPPLTEAPPAPLDGILENAPAAAGLEAAFYWIRDKVRYAAVRSGVEQIGHADRGRKIVEAGVGDCKDKSYLLALICQRIGMPYDFLCVSTANGTLIDDMPADQFDHVFVRARDGDRWLYLDAANQLATFGSAPAWCQGMQALTLSDPPAIVDIPVDPPDVNLLEIRECFDSFRDGRVAGSFEVVAEGQNARLADERWKAVSLSMDDQLLVGQEGLSRYLRAAIVDDYSKGGETSDSSRFQVEGIHSRGPFTLLERHGRAVLPLAWEVPTLPLGYWRILQLAHLFVVDLPVTVRIILRFEGEVRQAVDDVSRVPSLDNSMARVTEEVVTEPDALEIRRTLQIKKKTVRGGETKLVPPSLEHFEKALQMVVACRAEAVSGMETR